MLLRVLRGHTPVFESSSVTKLFGWFIPCSLTALPAGSSRLPSSLQLSCEDDWSEQDRLPLFSGHHPDTVIALHLPRDSAKALDFCPFRRESRDDVYEKRTLVGARLLKRNRAFKRSTIGRETRCKKQSSRSQRSSREPADALVPHY